MSQEIETFRRPLIHLCPGVAGGAGRFEGNPHMASFSIRTEGPTRIDTTQRLELMFDNAILRRLWCRVSDGRRHRRTTRPSRTQALPGVPSAPASTGAAQIGPPGDQGQALRDLWAIFRDASGPRRAAEASLPPSLLPGLLPVRGTQHVTPSVGHRRTRGAPRIPTPSEEPADLSVAEAAAPTPQGGAH